MKCLAADLATLNFSLRNSAANTPLLRHTAKIRLGTTREDFRTIVTRPLATDPVSVAL